LELLPNSDLYEKSYMHRDVVTYISVTKTNFIITSSQDGHVKFWKKQPKGIEFVKHFRAHLGSISGLSVSNDGLLLCTASTDQSIKIYDVINFDMINMFKLPYIPLTCEFIFKKGAGKALLACTDKQSPNIYIYDANGNETPIYTSTIHKAPVHILKYNEIFDTVISADQKGVIEYWSASNYSFPVDTVQFQYKTDTNLYEFAKSKTFPTWISISPDGTQFATMGKDRQVRLFRFLTGKLHRKYDESLAILHKIQKEQDDGIFKLDTMEFGRRMTIEREIDNTESTAPSSVIFDESGNFLLYPTMVGIKLINIHTNKLVKVLGKSESSTRFLYLALYQGKTSGSAATENLQTNPKPDPTLICTAFKKNRFYLFSRREPDTEESMEEGRDVFNERPTKDDSALSKPVVNRRLGRRAIIHSTYGDIHIKLFPEECPKTVENFSIHSKNGYYNNCIFHRVIRSFVIQTGDPRGDGTGGESIWGGEFEDEFVRTLRHDREGTVSMANAGPNTNGSQFFITTLPCPSLDNKHTVFGRVSTGMDIVKQIEQAKTDKQDKPLEDIKILNITILFTDE